MRKAVTTLILAFLVLPSALANVENVTENSFRVTLNVELNVRPQIAYQRLLRVGQWWQDDHTFFGRAQNMRIDANAGGCFCERLSNRSVEHMHVVHSDPGQLLRMTGALGPLQSLPADGVMSITLEADAGSTLLSLTYDVWGAPSANLKDWAEPVDQVLNIQFTRFQRFVNTGKADE